MKIFVSLLAFVTGCFMLLDGFHVLMRGKYIGPEKPGPWANLFYELEINVYKLGPLFIFFGVLWLIWLYGLWNKESWMQKFGIVLCIVSLWYLPIGSVISVIILLWLVFSVKQNAPTV